MNSQDQNPQNPQKPEDNFIIKSIEWIGSHIVGPICAVLFICAIISWIPMMIFGG